MSRLRTLGLVLALTLGLLAPLLPAAAAQAGSGPTAVLSAQTATASVATAAATALQDGPGDEAPAQQRRVVIIIVIVVIIIIIIIIIVVRRRR